jgi:hypothetical protein
MQPIPQHTIQVTITETGEIKATVQGVNGPTCGQLSAFLDELGKVVEDQRTPDFYRQQAVTSGQRLTTGH